jgi:hypothetical protein
VKPLDSGVRHGRHFRGPGKLFTYWIVKSGKEFTIAAGAGETEPVAIQRKKV